MRRMAEAGFDEVALAWRMLADTILVAFTLPPSTSDTG